MKKYFIYLLFLMLVACELVACQRQCNEGQTLVGGQCQQCNNIISLNQQNCGDKCSEGEVIEEKIGYKSCVKECSKGQALDSIHCEEDCLLIDKRDQKFKCLSTYEECQQQNENELNGLISKNGKNCQAECLSNEIEIDKQSYTQCGDCPKGRRVEFVDSLKVCVKICERGQIYDLISDSCILSSNCLGFLTEDQSYCVKQCNYYVRILTKGGKTIQYCSRNCLKMSYTSNEPWSYCYDKCPSYFISDYHNNKCVINGKDCPYALSADRTECVEPCGREEFQYIETKMCLKECQHLKYKYNYQQICAKQCPKNSREDTTNKLCKIDINYCNLKPSADKEQCVEKCEENEFVNQTSPQNFCSSGCEQFQYEENYQKFCTNSCPTNMTQNNKLCKVIASECELLSADSTQCVKSCKQNEIIIQDEQGKYKCTKDQCFNFKYQSNKKTYCYNKCPSGLITDNHSQECKKYPQECLVAVSADESVCVEQCGENEFMNMRMEYGICQKECFDFTFTKDNQQYCYKECPEGTVPDRSKWICETIKISRQNIQHISLFMLLLLILT